MPRIKRNATPPTTPSTTPPTSTLPRVVQMTFNVEELAAINGALLFAVAVLMIRPNQELLQTLTATTHHVLEDLGNERWHHLMVRIRRAALDGFPDGRWKSLDDVLLDLDGKL